MVSCWHMSIYSTSPSRPDRLAVPEMQLNNVSERSLRHIQYHMRVVDIVPYHATSRDDQAGSTIKTGSCEEGIRGVSGSQRVDER